MSITEKCTCCNERVVTNTIAYVTAVTRRRKHPRPYEPILVCPKVSSSGTSVAGESTRACEEMIRIPMKLIIIAIISNLEMLSPIV